MVAFCLGWHCLYVSFRIDKSLDLRFQLGTLKMQRRDENIYHLYSRMVTEFKGEVSDLEILENLLPKLSAEAIKTLKLLAEEFAGTKKAK